MSHTWNKYEIVTASKLNSMENAVAGAEGGSGRVSNTVQLDAHDGSETFNFTPATILDQVQSGIIPVLKHTIGSNYALFGIANVWSHINIDTTEPPFELEYSMPNYHQHIFSDGLNENYFMRVTE